MSQKATVGELKVELSKTERKLQDVNVDGGGTPDDSHSSTASLAAATGNGGSESHNIEESQFREEMRCLKARRAMLTAHQFLDQVKVSICIGKTGRGLNGMSNDCKGGGVNTCIRNSCYPHSLTFSPLRILYTF